MSSRDNGFKIKLVKSVIIPTGTLRGDEETVGRTIEYLEWSIKRMNSLKKQVELLEECVDYCELTVDHADFCNYREGDIKAKCSCMDRHIYNMSRVKDITRETKMN